MKTTFKLLILSSLVSINACSNSNKKGSKKNIVKDTTKLLPKKKLEVNVKKPWDSLNRLNAKAYLTKFGKETNASKVIIKTKFGNIKLKLYKDVPIHRANFLFLIKAKYFNTTVIYRVAKNFVIQGGNSDEAYTQKLRNKYGNYLLEPEFKPHRRHKYGALAAAREWDNNPFKMSSPFEFYMVHSKKGAHHLDNEHTVFGEVISGFDTMDKISKVAVGVDEWPEEDIDMVIEVLE